VRAWSKDCFDFGIEGDVSGGDAVDGEFFACDLAEMEEAADVVVLVVAGKKAFGFTGIKMKGRERHRTSEFTGKSAIAANQIAQRHHGSSASGFGGHLTPQVGSVQRGGREEKKWRQRARFLARDSFARYWRIVPGRFSPAANYGGRDAKAT